MMLHPAPGSLTIAVIALCCVAAAPPAYAQSATAWETVPHGAARLIAGAAHEAADGVWLRAGVEISLAPGWHTYWRYPGASGVPPSFEFAGSENVKSVTVLWPAPVVFADGAGSRSIGYVEHVVFPLRVVARDASKPALLHVDLRYAICRELCQPAEATLTLVLSAVVDPSASEAVLAAAEARVPRPVALDESAAFGIRSVHREADHGRPHVVVDVAAPEGCRSTSSSKDRRPIGRCRCPGQLRRCLAAHQTCIDSRSIWTVCPRARAQKARCFGLHSCHPPMPWKS